MRRHILVNLWLVGLTLLLCSVVYPLVLYAIGRVAFRHQAAGSLLDANGRPTLDASKAVGSRSIAQPFTKDEYFQPRPSATSPFAYNAAASGASNWGASNPLLRDRVARALGPIVTYKNGRPVGPDIEAWFQKDHFQGKPGIVAQWAAAFPSLAQNWVKADKRNAAYAAAWQKAHPADVAQWVKANPGTPEPTPADLAVPFFTSYSAGFPGTFPAAVEQRIEPVRQGSDIQSTFFDMWLQAHPKEELEKVPADLVMASGSGLDPDITLENARWQLRHRLAAAWAGKLVAQRAEPAWKAAPEAQRKEILERVRKELEAALGKSLEERIIETVEALLNEKKQAPLGGVAGVPMVNVLELNLALPKRMEGLLPPGQ